jgi:hypothetical protein
MFVATPSNPYASPADLSRAVSRASIGEAILEAGERVVWSGRPRLRAFVASTLLGSMIGTAGLGAAVVGLRFFIGPGFGNPTEWSLIIVGMGMWLCLPAWVLPWAWWTSRHTHYLITDQRAIEFAFRWHGYRVIVNAAEDIGFARYVGSFLGRWGAISWSEPTAWAQVHWIFRTPHGCFIAIPNARDVFRLMQATFAPRLAERLSDRDPEMRRKAAFGLTRVEALPDEVARDIAGSLIAALESDDAVVRARVALALGRLGMAAAEAIPALKRVALNDESRQVVGNARKAIERLAIS